MPVERGFAESVERELGSKLAAAGFAITATSCVRATYENDALLVSIAHTPEGAPGRLYRDPQFPVVELACALKQWASDPWAIRDDFEFDSMSTPEPGWVWLRRSGEGWRVGSIHQDEPCMHVWEEDQVQAAIQGFVSGTVAAVRASASVDPARWLPVLDER